MNATMNHCPRCGQQISAGARFCRRCGMAVSPGTFTGPPPIPYRRYRCGPRFFGWFWILFFIFAFSHLGQRHWSFWPVTMYGGSAPVAHHMHTYDWSGNQ
jgi:hypothetical protein